MPYHFQYPCTTIVLFPSSINKFYISFPLCSSLSHVIVWCIFHFLPFVSLFFRVCFFLFFCINLKKTATKMKHAENAKSKSCATTNFNFPLVFSTFVNQQQAVLTQPAQCSVLSLRQNCQRFENFFNLNSFLILWRQKFGCDWNR